MADRPVVEQAKIPVPDLLFERYEGRLEFHEPWHLDRETSHLFRGEVDTEEVNAFLGESGHGDL
ncbi:MAG: HAD family phosphatase, partial [Solirubrobacterales bacterium]